MTPKEKAQDLVNKYINLTDGWVMGIENWKHKKKCALIAVDEILNSYPHTFDKDVEYLRSGEEVVSIVNIRPNVGYWQEVKQEIEKL
jgi:hypothetical protein